MKKIIVVLLAAGAALIVKKKLNQSNAERSVWAEATDSVAASN